MDLDLGDGVIIPEDVGVGRRSSSMQLKFY